MKFVSDVRKGLLLNPLQQEVARTASASQGQGQQRMEAAAEVPGYWPQGKHKFYSYLTVV